MSGTTQELEKCFRDRPKLLQDATRRLTQNGTLTERDYTELLASCTPEATGQPVTFSGLLAGALAVQDTTKPLRLESIADVQGINALTPSKPLEFGKTPLCIVYGRNGAGKSGYVRLLKHACGVRCLGSVPVQFPDPEELRHILSKAARKRRPRIPLRNRYRLVRGVLLEKDVL